jgi:hypothetical protein
MSEKEKVMFVCPAYSGYSVCYQDGITVYDHDPSGAVIKRISQETKNGNFQRHFLITDVPELIAKLDADPNVKRVDALESGDMVDTRSWITYSEVMSMGFSPAKLTQLIALDPTIKKLDGNKKFYDSNKLSTMAMEGKSE